jgi:hypothetical protein
VLLGLCVVAGCWSKSTQPISDSVNTGSDSAIGGSASNPIGKRGIESVDDRAERLTRNADRLRFLRAPQLQEIPLPDFIGTHAIWGATGKDERGRIYFGVAGYGVDDPSAHLLRYDPTLGECSDLGGVNAILSRLGIRKTIDFDETQMKIHSKIFQAADGNIYFSSQDEHDEKGDGSGNAKFGGRLFALDPRNDRWTCVLAAPEGLIAAACESRYVYAMGYFGNVIYRYDTKTKETRSIKLGTMGGHVSRNIFVDSNEHLFASRLTPGTSIEEPGTTLLNGTLVRSTLVELNPELKIVNEWPLDDYKPTLDTDSHGITGFCRLTGGDVVFITHSGAIWLLESEGPRDHRLQRLGWMHYEGPAYVASLFSPLGERFVGGFVQTKDRGYEWVIFDVEQRASTRLRLAQEDQKILETPGLLLYGCETLDGNENAYVVGWKKVERGYGPIAIRVEWK